MATVQKLASAALRCEIITPTENIPIFSFYPRISNYPRIIVNGIIGHTVTAGMLFNMPDLYRRQIICQVTLTSHLLSAMVYLESCMT